MIIKLKTIALFIFLNVVTVLATAKCNNLSISDPPTADIKVFIGYLQPEQVMLDGGVDSERDAARAKPLHADILDKSGDGKFSADSRTNVSYYEPDGNGGWRVCRIEYWWPPNHGDSESRLQQQRVSLDYIKKSVSLSGIPVGATISAVNMIFYDEQGRLERFVSGDIENVKNQAIVEWCRRYDSKDRVLLEIYPRVTKTCPKGEPDKRDGWKRFKYGEENGKTIKLLALSHAGNENGSWSEKIEFLTRPGKSGVGGHAEVDSVNGLTLIYGSNVGKLDDNSANTVVNEFGKWDSSSYTFTKLPVPADVLETPI